MDFDLNKFISELSPIKIFIMGVVVCSMFFYIDIFLFGSWLIKNEPPQISILLSLCLGFIYFSLYLACAIFLEYLNYIYVKSKTQIDLQFMLLALLISSVMLGLSTAIIKYFGTKNFTSFLYDLFKMSVAAVIVENIISWIARRRSNKKKAASS